MHRHSSHCGHRQTATAASYSSVQQGVLCRHSPFLPARKTAGDREHDACELAEQRLDPHHPRQVDAVEKALRAVQRIRAYYSVLERVLHACGGGGR